MTPVNVLTACTNGAWRAAQVPQLLVLFAELTSLANTETTLTFATAGNRTYSFETRVRWAGAPPSSALGQIVCCLYTCT
jgi:hypothetical protein